MTEQVRALLDMPHHVSRRRPQMSGMERAAQFAPFAALKGYDEAIDQTALIPEPDWEPDEDAIAALNAAMERLAAMPRGERNVQICRMQRDKVLGTRYTHIACQVRSIDTASRTLTLEHGDILSLDEIASIRLAEDAQGLGSDES